jgi:hypothetical protein
MIKANASAEFSFMPVTDGVYENFYIRFYDQDGDRLQLGDTDIALTLIFRKRDPKSKIQELRKEFRR